MDIARVSANAEGWFADDGRRVEFSMERAVSLLNTHVAAYFRRVSQDKLRITFRAGHEFDVGGNGLPDAMNDQFHQLAGACIEECEHGAPGGLNRLLLDDVAAHTGGNAWNGSAHFGLASFELEHMETIVHEMGHGWMMWPHSYAEVPWRGAAGEELSGPNSYSNFYDVMSQLDLLPIPGWDANMPSTLAINRYAAGWIDRDDVALHLTDSATYTLDRPFGEGHQFLVIHSGRRYAFTTLEVLEERADRYKVSRAEVYDPSSPSGAPRAPLRRRAGQPLRPDVGHRHQRADRSGALRQDQPGVPHRRALGPERPFPHSGRRHEGHRRGRQRPRGKKRRRRL